MRYSALSLRRQGLAGQTGWPQAWRSPAPRPVYDAVIVGGGGHGLVVAGEVDDFDFFFVRAAG